MIDGQVDKDEDARVRCYAKKAQNCSSGSGADVLNDVL